MNSIALLSSIIAALVTSTSAFSPISAHRNHGHTTTSPSGSSGSSPTSLYSITFEPPPEDNCEVDGTNCEESVFERKRRERTEADNAIKDRYAQQGIQLSDVDLYESVDQYQNAPTGGNLIPGVMLTSLCEDD